ncbi:MAG: hypothetical protein AAF219_11435 [Myxococcota bacterium]
MKPTTELSPKNSVMVRRVTGVFESFGSPQSLSIRKLKEIHTVIHPAKAVRSPRADDNAEAAGEDELLGSLAGEDESDDLTMALSEKES